MSEKPKDKYEPLDPIAAAQRRRFAIHANELKAKFAELNETIVRTIPDDVFRLHFLKFFSGEEKEGWREKLNHWLTIAGNQRNAVNVVDAKGKVLIKVPPIYGGNLLAPIAERREDVRYAMHVSQTKAQISPTLAHNHIAIELVARLNIMRANGNAQKDADEWIALFKYYGKLPKGALPGLSNNTQGDDDEFEF